ncbi:MAG: glycosyltransferase [Chloroflexota bacterium]
MPTQRIAFISVHGCPLARPGSKDTGGMSVYVHQLAQTLGQLGFLVDIYTRIHDSHCPMLVNLDENVRVIHVRAGPVRAPKDDLFRYLPRFIAQVKAYQEKHQIRYALVHTHYWLSGWVGQALAGEWGVPHVTTFHTLAEVKARARAGEKESDARSASERQVAASVDRIIVSTAHERGALQRLYDADEEKVRVVHPGVDLGLFKPGDQRAARGQLGLNGHHTLLYVGRLDPIKGLEVLLHTLRSMDTPREVQLLVAGGSKRDEEYRRLKGVARKLDVQCKVEFLGSLDHTLLPLYYQAADVCVVPSYYESFGLVALEAMACGTPVVASRVPGLEAIVGDNRSGYLVAWHCPDAFADRLEVLLANDALRQSMGREAHAMAQDMSWDGAARAVAEVYAELGILALASPPL